MIVKALKDCNEFLAGDKTVLRELLHPEKADLSLRYSLAHAVVKPGDTSLRHKLTVSEVYYILEGVGILRIGEESRRVGAGEAIYIPPHSIQSIENIGKTDLKFLCIVDPAWRSDYEEVF